MEESNQRLVNPVFLLKQKNGAGVSKVKSSPAVRLQGQAEERLFKNLCKDRPENGERLSPLVLKNNLGV